MSSSGVAVAPLLSTTHALTASPRYESGIPITPAGFKINYLNVCVRQRHSNAARLAASERRRRVSDRRGLCEAITFAECAPGQALELLDDFEGQGGRTAIEGAQSVHAVLFCFWMIEQRNVDGGDGRKIGG